MTPARWCARIVGAGAFVIRTTFALGYYGFSGDQEVIVGWVIRGILGAGLLLAIFWTGIGEIVGGLLLVGGGLWMGFLYLPPQTGELAAGAVFAFPGLLFIICGWYALAHERPRATSTAS